MFWQILFKVLLLQAVLAAVIVFVLWKALNRQLVELALRKFEVFVKNGGQGQSYTLVVTSPGVLSPKVQRRITQIIDSKSGRVVQFQRVVDKTLKGGLVIKCNDQIIDCSLSSRLKDSGFFK